MGNAEIRNTHLTPRLLQQLLSQNPGIDEEDISYLQQQQQKQQSIFIEDYYLQKSKNYYNYIKRLKKYKTGLKSKLSRLEVIDDLKKIQNRDISYTFSENHCFIPNTFNLVENINTDAYNLTMTSQGDKLLITSRQGLQVFSEKQENLNQLTFDQQVYPGSITWAISDSDISRDGNFLVHSTLNPYISLYSLERKKYMHIFNVSDDGQNYDPEDWDTRVRVFSVKFNSDANQFIASTGASRTEEAKLKLYDVQHQYLSKSIPAHDEDINTITFLQRENPNVFLSGSDDSLIKIWDTRALGVQNRPSGYLLGHLCGITKLTSREDGFYVASNSKDQTCRLWDIRKSCETNNQKPSKAFFYDYRGYALSQREINKHKNLSQKEHFDNSITKFYGHKVFRTLIRCHFSPQSSTGSRYIYTGSGDGKVFIYDILTGETVATLDAGEEEVIRDLTWHPHKNLIYVAGWDGNLVEWKFNPDNCQIKTKQKEQENNQFQSDEYRNYFKSQIQGVEEDDEENEDEDYQYDDSENNEIEMEQEQDNESSSLNQQFLGNISNNNDSDNNGVENELQEVDQQNNNNNQSNEEKENNDIDEI